MSNVRRAALNVGPLIARHACPSSSNASTFQSLWSPWGSRTHGASSMLRGGVERLGPDETPIQPSRLTGGEGEREEENRSRGESHEGKAL